jgi:hypothetical protein
VAIGQFVSFPFLRKEYAELRYLVSARDHVSIQRTATLTWLKSVLQVVWPEFEQVFPKFHYITPLKLLARYPGPGDLLKARKRQVVKLLKEVSRNHLGEKTYQQLVAAAECTVGLPIAQGRTQRRDPAANRADRRLCAADGVDRKPDGGGAPDPPGSGVPPLHPWSSAGVGSHLPRADR